jgi:S1-C subfamily serine protease/thiol-disulfide isomerase/thioredoxin
MSTQDNLPTAKKNVSPWIWIIAANIAILALLVGIAVKFWPKNPPAAPSDRTEIAKDTAPPKTPDMVESRKTPPSSASVAAPAAETAQEASPSEKIPEKVTSPAPAGPPSVADVIERVDRGVVLINSFDTKGNKGGFGSGFVIDAAGLVATNLHVLRTASKAEATFVDGTKIEIAGCRAWDDESDLAILELAKCPEKMQVVPLCQDTARKQAADVIAIGHPQGFKFTTTTGIISAVHTTAELPEPYRNLYIYTRPESVWIQTNAAISGGSSGGPLLNARGEAIGINTWVAQGQNLGFAADVRHLIALKDKMQTPAVALAELTGPEETLRDLSSEFGTRYMWFRQESAAAETKEATEKLVEAKHPAAEYMPKLFELADKHRKKPVAYSALQTVCQMAGKIPDCPKACNETFKRAADRLAEDYSGNLRLMPCILTLANSPLDEARSFLRRLNKENANREIQGAALYSLAVSLQSGDEIDQQRREEAIAALERIVKEYSEIEISQYPLGKLVEPQIFRLKFLAVGCTPPNIEGADIEGNRFALADFRGKVVVLDFWADWCPHCVAMYPVERKLVERHADKPFALLGVNCDDPSRLKKVLDAKTVIWKNWADGPQGPIAKQWYIEGFPTLFVLDREGVIRYKDVRGEELEKAVGELLGIPAEKDAKTPEKDAPPAAAQEEKPAAQEEKPSSAPEEKPAATPEEKPSADPAKGEKPSEKPPAGK